MAMYRVRTVFTGVTGSPYLSTQFFIASDPATGTLAAAAKTKVANMWAAMTTQMSNLLSFTVQSPVDVIDPSTGNLENSFAVTPTPGVCNLTGDPLPFMSQGLIRVETGVILAGKRLRGRIFVPGPTENVNGTGTPAGTYVSALTTAAQSLLAAGDPVLAVWHRPPPGGNTGLAVGAVGATGQPKWAVLRSRRD